MDGVRLSNAFSQSIWTVPSSVSILTGLYPKTHRATTTYDQIPDDAPRIAKRFQSLGYSTGAVSSVTQVSQRRNFHRGFDKFCEIFKENPSHKSDSAKLCTDNVVDWFETIGTDKPFFAFVWSFGTHEPYEPRAGVFSDETTSIDGSVNALADASYEHRNAVCDVYDDAIRHADAQFGRLVDYLKKTGQYDNTLIVFTSDHGEILSEHGRMEHAPDLLQKTAKRFAPRFCSKYSLFDRYGRVGHQVILPYEELIHVPAVIKPPAELDWQGEQDGLAQTIDLMPTVADAVGIDFPTQGQSLRPLVENGEEINQYVYSDTTQTSGVGRFKSVRSLEHKYIREEIDRTSKLEHLTLGKTAFSIFRNLVVDSELLLDINGGEMHDLKHSLPDRLEEFRSAFRKWEDRNERAADKYVTERARVNESVREELKNLGYLD
jgi:arylsulfatase A-like enzyme